MPGANNLRSNLVRRGDFREHGGFTLIELLVVIAIIALLAAILFPVFSRARENARRTTCMSNMKQLGLGIMQYTQDSDGIYPARWSDTYTGTGDAGTSNPDGLDMNWTDMIYPYVKNPQVYTCPDRSSEEYSFYTPQPRNTVDDFFWGTYDINATYGAYNSPYLYSPSPYTTTYYGASPAGAPESAVSDTPGTIFLSEGSTAWGDAALTTGGIQFGNKGGQIYWPGGTNPTPQTTTEPYTMSVTNAFVEAPHLDTTNVLFCDGHVKSEQTSFLMQSYSVGSKTFFIHWTIQSDCTSGPC